MTKTKYLRFKQMKKIFKINKGDDIFSVFP